MTQKQFSNIFTTKKMTELFPKERSNDFFEALFGDASEGAYDISLSFNSASDKELHFDLNLNQRPGCCLVCSLTQGLPNVFTRHPLINIQGVVDKIDELLGDSATCGEWQLQNTIGHSSKHHVIPLVISYR